MDDRCRGVLLDEGRTGDPIAGFEPGSVKGRRVDKSARSEIDRTGLARRFRRRVGFSCGDLFEAGLVEEPGYGTAQADDFRRLVRGRMAVADVVDRIETPLDAGAVFGLEQFERQFHG